MNYNDVLEHFGILGMKWGRKKGKSTTGNKPKYSKDHVLSEKAKKKSISELSNDDLRVLSERMSLEKNYAKLNKKELSEGKKFVRDLMVNIAKEQLTVFLKSGATKMMSRKAG